MVARGDFGLLIVFFQSHTTALEKGDPGYAQNGTSTCLKPTLAGYLQKP